MIDTQHFIPWRNALQPASFRGVPFGVQAAGDAVGRRTVTHEFVQSDDPYVEDLGSTPRVINLTAFVLGRDYMAGRDALQNALDTPGPGTLVHPWYGSITVCLSAPAQISHSAQDGGMVVFTLTFTRVDTPTTPSPVQNPRSLVGQLADAAEFATAALLDARLVIAGYGAWVLEQAANVVDASISQAAEFLGIDPASVSSWADDAKSGLYLYQSITSPGGFGASFVGLFQGMAANLHMENRGRSPYPLFNLTAQTPVYTVPPVAGISRTLAAHNAMAITDAVRAASAAEAMRHAAQWQPETRTEAGGMRGQIMDAVELVLHNAAHIPSGPGMQPSGDAVYTAYADLRVRALAAVAQNAGTAADVLSVHTLAILPSLFVAHAHSSAQHFDRTTSAARMAEAAADVVARNSVPHPGFVPAGQTLEVLRRA